MHHATEDAEPWAVLIWPVDRATAYSSGPNGGGEDESISSSSRCTAPSKDLIQVHAHPCSYCASGVGTRCTRGGLRHACATTAPAHRLRRSRLKVSEVERKKKKKENKKKKETANQNNPAGFLAAGVSRWMRAIMPQWKAPRSLRARPHGGIHFNPSDSIHRLWRLPVILAHLEKFLWPKGLIEENCGNTTCVAHKHGGPD